MSGFFITIEGIEGVGKSTQVEAIRAWLERRGRKVVVTREPGGTPLAERLRELVLLPQGESVGPVSELLLMFAARSVHLDNRIRPALAQGAVVVAEIAALEQLVQGALRPDLTLLLDAPAEVGQARAQKRRNPGGTDRFETERIEFFRKVRAKYLQRARAEPGRIEVIDASADAAQVAAEIENVLARRFA